jgi:2,3-bisphosphoglycerate-dependent phosphoglycerate mutase
VRHGASDWNLKNIFTGWIDISLAPQGITEAHAAAQKLKNYHFDVAFTSVLKRATETLDIVLQDLSQTHIPVFKDKALNERHYGDLQGKNKEDIRKEVGDSQLLLWRRSYDVAPPHGESLKDTAARTLPYFKEKILPELKAGKTVLVSAHGNSLRSIVMDLEKLSPDEILHVNIPTGIPWVYEFDGTMNLTKKTIL